MLSHRIHYPQDEVATLHSFAHVSHHFASQRAVRLMHAWSINEDDLSCRSSLLFGNVDDPENAITGGLWLRANNGKFLPDEFIQQSGFAGIRTSEDANESGTKRHVAGLYQLHLSRLRNRDPHSFHASLRRLQNLETQPVVFDHFALARNAARQFAYQSCYRGRLFILGSDAKQLTEPVHVHVPRHDIGLLALPYYFGFFVFVANLSDNFFYQVFDGDQACNPAVLVYDNGHADVVVLHLAQQIA